MPTDGAKNRRLCGLHRKRCASRDGARQQAANPMASAGEVKAAARAAGCLII
ncbi:MAG TPA: hypothetical protein PL143_19160 [Rhodocyclaceae bacterium]|nr:hypothetical protein [Rhodocyclaceae bacterium]